MLLDIVKKGSIDRSVVLRIIDSADGTPETGVVFNTSGIDLWYRREGATKTSITEAALTALDDAHADGGFLHIGDGYYRLDLPDAAFASGANHVDIGGTVTGMVVIGGRVRLVDYPIESSTPAVDVTHWSNQPVAAVASNGYPVVTLKVGAGTGEVGLSSGAVPVTGDLTNTMKASVNAEADTAISDAALATAANLAAAKAVVDAIKAVTDLLPDAGALSSLATSAEIAGLNDLDAAGIRAALGMSSANLDTQLATIHDFLDTEVLAIYDLLDTEVAAILAKVNALSSDPADQSAVEAAINAAEAAILDKLLGYVQLLARKDAGIATDRATELGEINADEGSGAGGYASTTDAQEAIRDRGDAAWTGSGGGSGPTAVEIRQEIDANSTQLAAIKTQTDALPGDPAGQSAVEAAIVSATSGLATAAALSTVDGVADAIKAKTDNLPASPAATGDIPSASTIAGAVWDTLTSALTTVGSIGKLLVDRIDAAVSSRSTYAGGDTAGTTTLLSRLTSTRAGYLDNLSGHVAQSGDAYAIVSDGAHGNAALKALIDTVDDFLDTEIAAILLDTGTTLDDFVDDLEARLTANVAAALQAHAPALGRLVVGSGSTTTAIVFGTVNDATPSSVDDHYNGRVIVFTSGALALQAVEITDYDGATKTASISQATGAPGNGTTAVIV